MLNNNINKKWTVNNLSEKNFLYFIKNIKGNEILNVLNSKNLFKIQQYLIFEQSYKILLTLNSIRIQLLYIL